MDDMVSAGAENEDIAKRVLDTNSSNQFVTFSAGGTNYGVDIMGVREIRSWTPTTELPGRDPSARGMLDIRGKVVEVFDLSVALGGAPSPEQPEQVIVVVSLVDREVGLLVDAVSDIIFAEPNQLLAPPDTDAMSGRNVTALVNQEDGLIAVLDVAALFSNATAH